MVWACHLCAWRVTWSFASQTEENILLVWILTCDPEETRPEALPESSLYHVEPSRSRPSVCHPGPRRGESQALYRSRGGAALSKMPSQARLWEAGGSVRVWRWEQEGRCDSGARRSPHTSWQLGEPASGEELLGQATNKLAKCPSYLDINVALCPLPVFKYLSAVETWLWHSSWAV